MLKYLFRILWGEGRVSYFDWYKPIPSEFEKKDDIQGNFIVEQLNGDHWERVAIGQNFFDSHEYDKAFKKEVKENIIRC